MYEERAVLVMFFLAALLSLLSFLLAIKHRSVEGKNKLFLPLVFGAVSVLLCIVYVGHQIGLMQHF
jgi:asparagine N-glycosylation enzyme membrane subunit Stt3